MSRFRLILISITWLCERGVEQTQRACETLLHRRFRYLTLTGVMVFLKVGGRRYSKKCLHIIPFSLPAFFSLVSFFDACQLFHSSALTDRHSWVFDFVFSVLLMRLYVPLFKCRFILLLSSFSTAFINCPSPCKNQSINKSIRSIQHSIEASLKVKRYSNKSCKSCNKFLFARNILKVIQKNTVT